jgi:hypothetical protein
VSRMKMTMSLKSSRVRGRQLQARAPAISFLSASSSSRRCRPCSFIILIFGAWPITFHSSALCSIRRNVRKAQLAFAAEPGNPLPSNVAVCRNRLVFMQVIDVSGDCVLRTPCSIRLGLKLLSPRGARGEKKISMPPESSRLSAMAKRIPSAPPSDNCGTTFEINLIHGFVSLVDRSPFYWGDTQDG